MQFAVKLSESTIARRRVPIYLVDATDGYTPETGVLTPTIEVSKNGAAQASGSGTFAEVGDGVYYYEFAAGEIDTLGWINLRCVKSGTSREYQAIIHIVAYDPYAAAGLGLTEVAAIKVKTDSLPASPAATGDAMALTVSERNSVTDTMLGRSVATVEGTAAEWSLCTIILASLESSVSGTTWTIKRTDGTTTHYTKTVTKTSGDAPIRGVA